MQESKVLLSIGILISGRKETRKCLDSLKPILDQIPSELILTDTGCDPDTRALIEQYTDRIYEFEWCRDFAKARNVGLKAAKGEWFIYLDDDEWFEDPAEIIDFFKSGEYERYNSATYLQRNYSDMSGKGYADSTACRMIRILPDVVFEGKIHEYITPRRLPEKCFSCYVHHYGYVYASKQEEMAHAQRNIEPLMEMLQENKGDIRLVAQLVQEYYSIDDYEKLVDAAVEGIADYYKYGEVDFCSNIFLGAVYSFLLLALEMLHRYAEADEWIEKGLQIKDITIPNKAFLYLAGCRNEFRRNDFRRSCEFARKYLVLYDQYKDDKPLVMQEGRLLVENVFSASISYPMFKMATISALSAEDFKLARRVFFEMDWSSDILKNQSEAEKDMVKAASSVKFDQTSVDILQCLVSRPDGMLEMYPVFLQQEIAYKQRGEVQKLKQLRKLVAALDFDHRYIAYTKILAAPDHVPEDQLPETLIDLYASLFEKHGKEILEIKEEVWDVADRYRIPLEPLVLAMDCAAWKLQVEKWAKEANADTAVQVEKRFRKWQTVSDFRYEFLFMNCMEVRLRGVREAFYPMADLERLMAEYAEYVIDFYKPYYQEFVFTQAQMMLPLQAQFALRLRELCKARTEGTDKDVLEALRALKGFYAPMDDMLSYYSNLYKKEVHNRNSEMEVMANKLKNSAKLLWATGAKDEALNILNQLSGWFPEDVELQQLKEKFRMESL